MNDNVTNPHRTGSQRLDEDRPGPDPPSPAETPDRADSAQSSADRDARAASDTAADKHYEAL